MRSRAASLLHSAVAALIVAILPAGVRAKISAVGFRNRFYRGYGYTGSRVLEHNQTGRFQQYVEVNWTQSASIDNHGRVWIADRVRHVIILVDAGTRYIPWPAFYKDYAGSLHDPGHFDGFRLQARFDGPMGLVVSAVGQTLNIYVADTNNHCVRRVDTHRGRTSTIAGGPRIKGLRDGPGTEARFDSPMSLGIDSTGTKLFVLDNLRQIRYVDLSNPIPNVVTLIGGACRAVSRHIVVASIIIRRVGCHPDWDAKDEKVINNNGGVPGLQHFGQTMICVGHSASCNPRHHPAFADSRAPNRYSAPATQAG